MRVLIAGFELDLVGPDTGAEPEVVQRDMRLTPTWTERQASKATLAAREAEVEMIRLTRHPPPRLVGSRPRRSARRSSPDDNDDIR